ncbi:hypothetical protein V8C37DRAFT_385830 [Trichoderma ceciliae]
MTDKNLYQQVLNIGAVLSAFGESKLAFQQIEDGRPTVSNELLAPVVGEALALGLIKEDLIFSEDIINYVAVKHYIMFFQYGFTQCF